MPLIACKGCCFERNRDLNGICNAKRLTGYTFVGNFVSQPTECVLYLQGVTAVVTLNEEFEVFITSEQYKVGCLCILHHQYLSTWLLCFEQYSRLQVKRLSPRIRSMVELSRS